MDYDNRIQLLMSICLVVPVIVAFVHLGWCSAGDRERITAPVRDPLV